MIAVVFAAAIGFANLTQLVAAHPMHPVLASYDREIAALRSTQRVAGLTDIARRASAYADKARRAADTSAARATTFGRSVNADRAAESLALSEIIGLRGAQETRAYARDLQREAFAGSSAYEDAAAVRAARALAQRRVQLQERESRLAYDLARRTGPREMMARLKLNDLHLRPSQRGALRTELAQLQAGAASVLSKARAKDVVELANYRRDLERARSSDVAAMTAHFRAAATANLNLRRDIGTPRTTEVLRFRSTYNSGASSPLAGAFRAAGHRLSSGFNGLARADRESGAATSLQLRTLQADRDAVYRAMIAEIRRAAAVVARRRHLDRIALAYFRPSASIDVTAAVRSEINR